MTAFPITEPEIEQLAQEMVTGLSNNAAISAAPPVDPEAELASLLTVYTSTKEAITAAKAALTAATAAKDDALETLVEGMKRTVTSLQRTKIIDDSPVTEFILEP